MPAGRVGTVRLVDPEAAQRRAGTAAGAAAYAIWGAFPLVFHQLESVDAWEILLHPGGVVVPGGRPALGDPA